MRHTLPALALVLFTAILAFPPSVQGAVPDPSAFVTRFYAWFFEADAGKTPAVMQDGILDYVHPKTVTYLRGPAYREPECYFTKANTCAAVWNTRTTHVGEPIPMRDKVFAVPVRFDLKEQDYAESFHVIVWLHYTEAKLRIIRISDVYPHS